MGLSANFIQAHVAKWEASLAATYRSYRTKWPSRLFHHAPVQNAAAILRRGELLSRIDSEGIRPFDIAGQNVIALRDRAHSFARLYFRPRTPTQYYIEGIKSRKNITITIQIHMPLYW